MTPSPNKLNWRVPKNLSFDVGSKLSLNMLIFNDHTTQKDQSPYCLKETEEERIVTKYKPGMKF